MVSRRDGREVQNRLASSFKELACQYPVEKITIKMITDKAGVIRPTFYNHFEDKYDLLEWIINEDILQPAQLLLDSGMLSEAMRLMFHSIAKEKEFYMHIARLEGQNSFQEMVTSRISNILSIMIELKLEGKTMVSSWLTPQHIAEYYSQSMTYVLMSWIQGGMELSAEELTKIYEFIITRSLADLLKDLPSFGQ